MRRWLNRKFPVRRRVISASGNASDEKITSKRKAQLTTIADERKEQKKVKKTQSSTPQFFIVNVIWNTRTSLDNFCQLLSTLRANCDE